MSLFGIRKRSKDHSHKCQTRIYLNGGLGNQLFQLAFGVEISRIRNSTLFLDTKYLDQDVKRKFALNIFGVPENKTFELSESKVVLTSQENACDCEPIEIKESNFFFSEYSNLVLKKGHLTLQGYWQSPLYFQNSAENIRQFLKKSLPLNVLGDYAVIHIRRGDFFNDPKTLAYHGLITLDYYKAATQIIPSSAEKFLMISDDLDEAAKIRKVLKQLFEARDFEIFANSNSEIECFKLMSNANYVIAANSSFSWWGAFLSDSEVVVAPRKYLSSKTLREVNICDLYPEEWFLR